jgi:RimJ/RimL family protein N-acetyltransferase
VIAWEQRGGAAFSTIELFVSKRIFGNPRNMMGNTAMAVIKGNDFLGAAIYQNYDHDNGTIEISAASKSARWLSRSNLLEMFTYPFLELGCQAVVLRCDPDDSKLDRIFKAYGFNRYDIPRLRGRDKSEAIYILGDDEWRNNGFHKELQNG